MTRFESLLEVGLRRGFSQLRPKPKSFGTIADMATVKAVHVPDCIVQKVMNPLKEQGYKVFAVGGAVRDALMGLPVKDWDLATDAPPDVMLNIYDKAIPTGIEHGTVTVPVAGSNIEVTTFRTEGKYSDKRRPDSVHFVKNLEEDLARRDFTINALAYDVYQNELIDPFGGLKDIEGGLIRAVGDATARFEEDALRLLRASRFAARFNFTIEEKTYQAMAKQAQGISVISRERIRDELLKTLEATSPEVGLKSALRSAVLHHVFQHDVAGAILPRKPEKWLNFIAACAQAHLSTPCMLASFLWLGKPKREKVTAALKSLKLSNRFREKVESLLFVPPLATGEPSEYEARLWIARAGLENVFEALVIRDAAFKHNIETSAEVKKLLHSRKMIQNLLDGPNVFSLDRLHISGDDVKAICGVSEGAEVGAILKSAWKQVLWSPEMNNKDALKQWLVDNYRRDL